MVLEIPSTSKARRLHSSFLRLLVCTTLSFPMFTTAHIGVHEEIDELSRNIRENSGNPQLYISRGEGYRIDGHWDSAIADFSKALVIDSGNVAAETGLGRTYLDQGNPGQAIVHLNRALARKTGDVQALILRAKANAGIGNPLIAAADYTHAIEQFRGQQKPLPGYYLQRAQNYAAAGDPYIDAALEGLDEGINVLGNIRTLELYAVELETRRGNVDAALARLDSILAGAVRKEFLLLQRGDVQSAAGRKDAAVTDYRAALAAIDALPPQRRHTRSVRQLKADLGARLENHGICSDAE